MKTITRREVVTLGFIAAAGALSRITRSDEATKEGSANWRDPVLRKARTFLVELFDQELGLMPEYRGANVYWLFHDNYLATKVLGKSHPAVAEKIRLAMKREGIEKSGKIELLFGETNYQLPFRQFQLQDVRHVDKKVIRTEVVTPKAADGWQGYADLLLMASIAENNPTAVRQHWDQAMQTWDGNGFDDAATKSLQRYSTYKLGLALIATRRIPNVETPKGLLERLLSLQDDSGGWITDYDATGKKIGLANVETTCLAILSIESLT